MDMNMFVEVLARMTLQERDDFVKMLVDKWPHMAQSVGNMITLELMVKDKQDEMLALQ